MHSHCCATNTQNAFHFAKLKPYTHWLTTPHSPSHLRTNSHHSTFCLNEFDYSRHLCKWKHTVSVCVCCVCDWLINYTCTMFSRFIQVVLCVRTSFIFQAEWYSFVCMYLILFIRSSMVGYLGCSHLLTIVDCAAMNMCVQMSLWDPDFNCFV